ncbi:MAG: FAD:protein FMN transferase [Gammaproteobacteria bacterium]|nr:FAD:protein FMN transferase [Gammaproteobacteria bacterium]
MRSKSLFTLLLILLFGGCNKEAPLYQDQFIAMGTVYELSVYDIGQQQGQEISRLVQDDLKFMEFAWHAWKPGPLGRINQLLASGAEFSINPSVMPLVIQSKQLYTSSQGLFNPAIGELVQIWGFHTDDPSNTSPPDKHQVQKYMRDLPTMDDIEINGIRAQGHNPHIKLDFGGFAKGYAIEQILKHLQQQGIENASLYAEGDLKAIGRHGSRPWRAAIRNPRHLGIIGTIDVKDGESLFTSGNYQDGEKRIHHILDPRTGHPVPAIASATVIHDDAAVADAAAMALFVAGPGRWWEIARSMGIRYVLLVDEDGLIHMNPGMAERVEFELPLLMKPKISSALKH